jgi:hypothetical protein
MWAGAGMSPLKVRAWQRHRRSGHGGRSCAEIWVEYLGMDSKRYSFLRDNVFTGEPYDPVALTTRS